MCNLPGWNTEDAAAERLGKSKLTLAMWRKKGIGPKYARLGKSIIYSDAALTEYPTATEVVPVRMGR